MEVSHLRPAADLERQTRVRYPGRSAAIRGVVPAREAEKDGKDRAYPVQRAESRIVEVQESLYEALVRGFTPLSFVPRSVRRS